MFSVFIKPYYYLVKYHILYICFLMIPNSSHCVKDEIQPDDLINLHNEIQPDDLINLHNEISILSSYVQNDLEKNFKIVSELRSDFGEILEKDLCNIAQDLSNAEIHGVASTQLLKEMTYGVLARFQTIISSLQYQIKQVNNISDSHQKDILDSATNTNIQTHMQWTSNIFDKLVTNLTEIRVQSNEIQKIGLHINKKLDVFLVPSVDRLPEFFQSESVDRLPDLLQSIQDAKPGFSRVSDSMFKYFVKLQNIELKSECLAMTNSTQLKLQLKQMLEMSGEINNPSAFADYIIAHLDSISLN